jgi:cell division protein FtsB
MRFGKKQSPGSGSENPMLRSRTPGIGLKENVMRVSMLVLALSMACVTVPAPAQTIIDVEGQKAAPPPAPEPDRSHPPDDIATPPQDNQPAVPPSRFTFSRVNNGFLRLDNDSGQVAFCSTQGRGWACQAAAENQPALESQVAGLQDDVAALKKLETEIATLQDGVASVKKLPAEIARLRDEVSSLKKEIVALKEPPPPRPPAELTPPADKGADVTIKLPTREDMARASAFIQDTWRRFVDMINTVQKDMMRKG